LYNEGLRTNRLPDFFWAESEMVVQGVVQNGVIVPNEPLTVPEGTHVTIEIATADVVQAVSSLAPRQGGWLKGRVTIAPDFDELPDEIREAFGMN
jgi:predicted DNA-binding antitoxin AbrB/MazE fold protein